MMPVANPGDHGFHRLTGLLRTLAVLSGIGRKPNTRWLNREDDLARLLGALTIGIGEPRYTMAPMAGTNADDVPADAGPSLVTIFPRLGFIADHEPLRREMLGGCHTFPFQITAASAFSATIVHERTVFGWTR